MARTQTLVHMWGPEQGFWRYFADGPHQKFSSVCGAGYENDEREVCWLFVNLSIPFTLALHFLLELELAGEVSNFKAACWVQSGPKLLKYRKIPKVSPSI